MNDIVTMGMFSNFGFGSSVISGGAIYPPHEQYKEIKPIIIVKLIEDDVITEQNNKEELSSLKVELITDITNEQNNKEEIKVTLLE